MMQRMRQVRSFGWLGGLVSCAILGLVSVAGGAWCVGEAVGQQDPTGVGVGNAPAGGLAASPAGSDPAARLAPAGGVGTDTSLPQVAKLLPPPNNLPNDAGQVWRTYDLSPYTRRITSVRNPEQAVVDWILRDTGTDLWFRQPMGMMSVTPDSLHVYHSLEVQRVVAGMVDRLVESKGQRVTLGVRLVTVGRADWRSAAFPYMQPFEVQTPGVEGWLISKENAAILANQLAMRSDFRPMEVGDLILPEGQSHSFKRLTPQSYIRSLQFRPFNPTVPAAGGQYEPLTSRFEEGYTVDLSALGLLDQRLMEVVIKCQIDQLEKLQTVTIPVPTVNGQMQNLATAVPQVVSWRLHERFRWPKDQVLLLSCGVIATPTGQTTNTGLLNLGSLVGQQRGRADALLFIEFKGVQGAQPVNNQAGVFQAAPQVPNVGPMGPWGAGGGTAPGVPPYSGYPFPNPTGSVAPVGVGTGLGGPQPLNSASNATGMGGFRPTIAGPQSDGSTRMAAPAGNGLYPIVPR